MRTPSALLALTLAGLAGSLAGKSLVASGHAAGSQHTGQAVTKPAEPPVTAVTGPSWLHQLNIPAAGSNLGRGAGRYGPSPNEPATMGHGLPTIVARDDIALTGADLYRLNCRACHTAEGTGTPPETKSTLDLIQGSSLALVRKQFEHEGMHVDAATVRASAAKARAELYRRIRDGGQRMPPHAHLQPADIDVLYGYLTELAHAPDAPRQSHRAVSWARLGEHVVKGTCHICHDASGPRPTADAMLYGAIPPLNILRADNSRGAFIWKAKNGAPVVAGGPGFHYRGRMPVFYYLHEEELAAAYDFLVAYPPRADAGK